MNQKMVGTQNFASKPKKTLDGQGSETDHRSAEKVARQAMRSGDPKEGAQSTKINDRGTFVETSMSHGAGKGKQVRIVNMVISDKLGRKGFNELQNINSETDKISLSTGKAKDDRELNWHEMRVLEKSLAMDLESSKADVKKEEGAHR